jgi:hypothetical protein
MKRHVAKALMLTAFFSLTGAEKTLAYDIIYTFSGVGSGTLGVDSFSDASYAITLYADTSAIFTTPLLFGDSYVPDLSATVFVNGLGAATITSQMRVRDLQDLGMVGPATISLYNSENPAFAPILSVHPDTKVYILSEAIGPIGGTVLNYRITDASFATSDGDFSFSSLVSVRFQAVPQSVPESSMTTLVCAVSLALGFLTRKKQGGL